MCAPPPVSAIGTWESTESGWRNSVPVTKLCLRSTGEISVYLVGSAVSHTVLHGDAAASCADCLGYGQRFFNLIFLKAHNYSVAYDDSRERASFIDSLDLFNHCEPLLTGQ